MLGEVVAGRGGPAEKIGEVTGESTGVSVTGLGVMGDSVSGTMEVGDPVGAVVTGGKVEGASEDESGVETGAGGLGGPALETGE